MLLDLGRNDVGRVARIGTVHPTEKFIVERYSHVMHIVSNVVGDIAEGQDALSALLAGLPAGTVSGAPKVRAMEIIDELEPEKRGIYGGGVGYFAANGEMDMCIALRTAVAEGRSALHPGRRRGGLGQRSRGGMAGDRQQVPRHPPRRRGRRDVRDTRQRLSAAGVRPQPFAGVSSAAQHAARSPKGEIRPPQGHVVAKRVTPENWRARTTAPPPPPGRAIGPDCALSARAAAPRTRGDPSARAAAPSTSRAEPCRAGAGHEAQTQIRHRAPEDGRAPLRSRPEALGVAQARRTDIRVNAGSPRRPSQACPPEPG